MSLLCGQFVFADTAGFSLQLDKDVYKKNDPIEIEGDISNGSGVVTLSILNEAKTAVYYIDQLSANEAGHFSTKVSSYGMESGKYVVTVGNNGYKETKTFTISEDSTDVKRSFSLILGNSSNVEANTFQSIEGVTFENDMPVSGRLTVKVTDEFNSAVMYVDEFTSNAEGKYLEKFSVKGYAAGKYFIYVGFGDKVSKAIFNVNEVVDYEPEIIVSSISKVVKVNEPLEVHGRLMKNNKGVEGDIDLTVYQTINNLKQINRVFKVTAGEHGYFNYTWTPSLDEFDHSKDIELELSIDRTTVSKSIEFDHNIYYNDFSAYKSYGDKDKILVEGYAKQYGKPYVGEIKIDTREDVANTDNIVIKSVNSDSSGYFEASFDDTQFGSEDILVTAYVKSSFIFEKLFLKDRINLLGVNCPSEIKHGKKSGHKRQVRFIRRACFDFEHGYF